MFQESLRSFDYKNIILFFSIQGISMCNKER